MCMFRVLRRRVKAFEFKEAIKPIIVKSTFSHDFCVVAARKEKYRQGEIQTSFIFEVFFPSLVFVLVLYAICVLAKITVFCFSLFICLDAC